jgi:hypothetical protein
MQSGEADSFLYYIKQFYSFYSQDDCPIFQIHQMKTEADNPTIGLLICKTKDNIEAQYSLESSSQPLEISEYQLSKLLPKDFKSSLPLIEEIEQELGKKTKSVDGRR